MTKKKILWIVIILVIICGIITYLALRKTKEDHKLKTIKVSEVTRSVFYSPQYIAIKNGYFEEEELEIDLITGQGADNVMTAVLSNQCDIGFARTRSLNICI